MIYSFVSSFYKFSPYANAWNPYQGLSTPSNTSLGGNFTGYRNFSTGVGKILVFAGPQGAPYGSVGSTSYFRQPSTFTNPWHSFQNVWSSTQIGWSPQGPPRLPFLATLNLPDISKLTNDPIRYNPIWPLVLTKLPLDIPKFEGKNGEDPGDHVTNFHLWCLLNSLIDDSIKLKLFQRNLTRKAGKLYIELSGGTFSSFGDLATMFLNHF